MSWLNTLHTIDADSFRGKLSLLILDKLLIGAIIAVAFVAYDRYRASDQQRFEAKMVQQGHRLEMERSEWEAVREDRSAKIQREFERAELAKDLLPLVLDETADAVARGYVLRSALSTGLIDAEAAIEVAQTLHEQGLPDDDILRIARAALPDGLPAVARHGARLRDKWIQLEHHPSTIYLHESDLQNLSDESAAVATERRLWRTVLVMVSQELGGSSDGQINERGFLREHLSGLYFLLPNSNEPASSRFFQQSSGAFRLLGALDCLVHDWGPEQEAAQYVGEELSALNLTNLDDISYARTLIHILSLYGQPWASTTPADSTEVAPEVSVHLARLLVDDSFSHFVPWIEDSASIEARQEWFAERDAAGAHSSLQYEAGALLARIGSRAQGAEEVLVSFINKFVRDVSSTTTTDSLNILASQYGSYSVRFSIHVLSAMNTNGSRAAIQKVRQLGDDKLGAFEGIRMELEALGQRRDR